MRRFFLQTEKTEMLSNADENDKTDEKERRKAELFEKERQERLSKLDEWKVCTWWHLLLIFYYTHYYKLGELPAPAAGKLIFTRYVYGTQSLTCVGNKSFLATPNQIISLSRKSNRKNYYSRPSRMTRVFIFALGSARNGESETGRGASKVRIRSN